VRAPLLPLLLAVAGCLSEDAFYAKFDEKYCEEFRSCVSSESASCDDLSMLSFEETTCTFDRGAARDCLGGPWVCDTEFPGFEIPIPPAACASVCGTVPATVETVAGSDTGSTL
jgi:hypothetical protein